MLVYYYDENKIYSGYSEAFIDPVKSKEQGERVYLLPSNATFEAPPTEVNKIAKYEDNTWILINDFRGQYYVDSNMFPQEVTKVGDLPEECALITQEQIVLLNEKGKNYFLIENGVLIVNPNYEEEETEKRRARFLNDFFEVKNYGYYRKMPKGYQSAVESMNVLFNIANLTKGLQAGLIIFYEEPDFSKQEECTEEWLIEHQIIMPAMTLEEFMQLYVAFMTAWNTEEHIKTENN